MFCFKKLTCIAIGTRTRVLLERLQLASAAVEAPNMITGIRHRNLAQGLIESQWTLAGDTEAAVAKGHLAGAAVLAAHGAARIAVFTVLADIVRIATGRGERCRYIKRGFQGSSTINLNIISIIIYSNLFK